MMYALAAFIGFIVGGLVMFFDRQKAVNEARAAEHAAQLAISHMSFEAYRFKKNVRAALEKIENVPAESLAEIKNVVHGTAQKAGKAVEKL